MEANDRRLRGHVTGTAAVAAGFFVALVLLVLASQQEPAPTGQPSPTPTQPAAQETLLVQVTLARERAASLLTATGGEPDQAVIQSLPADVLLVDGPTYTPLLDANLSLNRRLAAQATESTLGVAVEGGWRMERKALAGLVAAVGGVTVTLAQPAVFLDEFKRPVLRLPAGDSLLNGPDASWYVMGVIPGENEVEGVQARFAEVFPKTVVRLPADVDEVVSILTSLGSLSDPLNGNGDVAQVLVGLRSNLLAGRLSSPGLPLRPATPADPVKSRDESRAGAARTAGSFRVVDYVAATPAIREAFALAPRVADVDGPPRVLVWNGTGDPRETRAALVQLTGADFVALSAGPWSGVVPVTMINGAGYSANGVSYASGVAEALRLVLPDEAGDTGTLSPVPTPSSDGAAPLMPAPDRVPWGDVDVVLGQDYQPCAPDDPECLAEVP